MSEEPIFDSLHAPRCGRPPMILGRRDTDPLPGPCTESVGHVPSSPWHSDGLYAWAKEVDHV